MECLGDDGIMDELIRRNDAINAIWLCEGVECDIKTPVVEKLKAMREVGELPAVGKCFEWVSCKDELPIKEDAYLVTWEAGFWKSKRFIGIATYYPPDEDEEGFDSDFGWELPEVTKSYKDVEILAWMDLPLAYEGE